jgi:hypothetical protein
MNHERISKVNSTDKAELEQKLVFFNQAPIKTAQMVQDRLNEIKRLRAWSIMNRKKLLAKEKEKLNNLPKTGHAGAKEVFKDMEKSL